MLATQRPIPLFVLVAFPVWGERHIVIKNLQSLGANRTDSPAALFRLQFESDHHGRKGQ